MDYTSTFRRTPLRRFTRMFLIIFLLEVFLFGGGRLLSLGVVSLRMYFFVIAMAVGLIHMVLVKKFNTNFIILLLFSTVLLVEGALVGVMNYAETEKILEDIKPLLSLFGIIFFYYAIDTRRDVLVVGQILKFCAVLLAVSYLSAFILINTKVLPFLWFYAIVTPTGEFFFRGDFAFFYKGFFFLVVGIFFVSIGRSALERFTLVILLTASLLTFTRGFILSIILVFLCYLIAIRKKIVPLMLLLTFLSVVGSSVWEFVQFDTKLNRTLSDSERIIQIREVMESVDEFSLFIGNGFGIGVESRPDHMEITYLEAFHKQGIFGLSFYLFIFLIAHILFQNACAAGNKRLATPFILAIWFTFILSMTNPFINNPIGINMVLIALVSLNVLQKRAELKEEENDYPHIKSQTDKVRTATI